MGGPGSGNWYRWDKRDTTADYHALDVRTLYRGGWLRPGVSGQSRWSYGDRETGAIAWDVLGDWDGRAAALELRYTSEGEAYRYRVALTYTGCHYGGARPWFVCPGCGRRVAILYGGRVFVCRRCRSLAYESSREQPYARAMRRAQKLRERLGDAGGWRSSASAKPRGMHWETHERLLDAALEAEEESLLGLVGWLDRRAPARTEAQ